MVAPRQVKRDFYQQVMSGALGPPSQNVEYPDTRQYLPYDNGGNGPWDVLQPQPQQQQPVDLGNQGSISRYDPSMRDAAAYWLARVWFGDNREGVAKAKRFLDVAQVAVPPVGTSFAANDITRAVRQGDYANAGLGAALGMLPMAPGLKAVHISPNEFNRFSMQKAGQGLGSFEGRGLYFSPPDSPATPWYQDLMTSGVVVNKHTGEAYDKANEASMINLGNDVYGLLRAGPLKHSSGKLSEVMAERSIIHLANPVSGPHLANTGTEGKVKALLDKYFTTDYTKPYRYDVGLNVGNPSDLPQLGVPLANQPEKYAKHIGEMASRTFPESKAVIKREPWQFQNSPPRVNTSVIWPEKGVGQSAWLDPNQVDQFVKNVFELNKLKRAADPVRTIGQYFGAKAPMEYNMYGIPAVRYPEYERVKSHEQGRYMNTLMFNDKLIEILKRTPLAAIPGIGAYLLSQQQGQQRVQQ